MDSDGLGKGIVKMVYPFPFFSLILSRMQRIDYAEYRFDFHLNFIRLFQTVACEDLKLHFEYGVFEKDNEPVRPIGLFLRRDAAQKKVTSINKKIGKDNTRRVQLETLFYHSTRYSLGRFLIFFRLLKLQKDKPKRGVLKKPNYLLLGPKYCTPVEGKRQKLDRKIFDL